MTATFNPLDPQEWSEDAGCEPFEMAIDMRSKDSLAPEAIPLLDAHLATCPGCRQHAANMRSLEVSLSTAARIPENFEWRRLDDRLRAGLRAARRRPWVLGCWMLGVLVLVGTLDYFLSDPPAPSIAAVSHRKLQLAPLAAAFASVMVIIVGASLWKVRSLRQLVQQRDVVSAYRRELERSLHAQKRQIRWWPVIMVAEGLHATTGYVQMSQGVSGGRFMAALGCLEFVGTIVVVIAQRRTKRRLERELAEMH